MNNEFNKIQEGIKSIKLSEAEKSLMKSDILSGVVLSPYSSVTNPVSPRLNYQWNIGGFTNSIFKHKNYMTALLLTLMLALGGGSSVMAENAIPGDALYQVKVSVNEPIVGMLTLSKEGDVAWKERLVERRLDEVQKVVAEGALSVSTQAEIEARVHAQVDKFTAAAKELSEDKNKEVISSELAVRLEAALRAHQDILVQAQVNGSIASSTRKNAKDLLSALKEDESKVRDHREEAELDLGDEDNNANASTTTKVAAENKQAVAVKMLDNVKSLYQSEKAGLSTSTRVSIEVNFVQIEKVLLEGKSLLVQAKYSDARDKFQEVLQLSNDVRVDILTGSIRVEIKDEVDSFKDNEKNNNNQRKDVSERNSKNDEIKSDDKDSSNASGTDKNGRNNSQDELDDTKNNEQGSLLKVDTEASLKLEGSQRSGEIEGSENLEIKTGLKINN